MFYKFDSQFLVWKKDYKKLYVCLIVSTLLMFGSFLFGVYHKIDALEEYEKELIVLNIQQEKNKFTKEKLVKEIKRLRIKYPHIVMAQSMLETNRWKSRIFIESNNLFGMKEAKSRITTANGTHLNHAYYNSWEESLYDYGFYQSRYLSKIKTENEYFLFLGESYAEDKDYVLKLKKLIEDEKLKELF
jgi:hypothetical protein